MYNKGVMTLVNRVQDIRILTEDDLHALQQMNTGIEDDYVIRIFPDLIKRDNNVVYGLFEGDKMVSVAGSTIFGDHLAMLGRLRSDIGYTSKGYASNILQFIKDDLKKQQNIKWIGAHTQTSNVAAKRVVHNITIPHFATTHPLVLTKPEKITGTEGAPWKEVHDLSMKREFIHSLKNQDLEVFPYEAYYPLPFEESLFTDTYLEECRCYLNEAKNRFVFIKDDQKGEFYAHVKYFWDDHYEQAGFWETVKMDLMRDPEKYGAWIDFSPQGFAAIPTLDPFDVTEAWELYGEWVKNE